MKSPTYAEQCAAGCHESRPSEFALRILDAINKEAGGCQELPNSFKHRIAFAIDTETFEQQELAAIGQSWRKDSSLEKWFPFTAEELSLIHI